MQQKLFKEQGMKRLIPLLLLIGLSSCTFNFIQTDTHGTASDVVDSEPKAEAQVTATATVPLAP